MLGRVAIGCVVVIISTTWVNAQEQERRASRPDIPGSFMIDIGVNRTLNNTPDDFDYAFWGSRTVNLYYQYPIRLWKTKFSINPGVGLGLERFKFRNNFTLDNQPDPEGAYQLVNAGTLYPGASKSSLVANYFDVPIELRFDTNPEDVARSFNIAVGARAGLLLDSFTKVKYTENDETKKIKDKQDHGLNSIRYGLYGRLGIGGFNLFIFYNTSPLFDTDKGPLKTNLNTFTTGISINGF